MDTPSADCIDIAARLNAGCHCTSLDRGRLGAELDRVSPGFHATVMAGRPHLFSNSLVFVGGEHVERMAALVRAIDRVVALPAYRDCVIGWAGDIAHHDPGTPGVFLGYDFHVGAAGPQLIEINTNAGGALLNALLARAQEACCDEVRAVLPGELGAAHSEALFVDMFRREWAAWHAKRRSGTTMVWRTLAIVDHDPAAQFLHPEFVLFQQLFRDAGIETFICDPSALRFADGALWLDDVRIDVVYNRLTDFALGEPGSAALRAAYLADAALVTPHPRAHALYADKRNLAVLTDDARLAGWGVDAESRAVLAASIPRTEVVDPAHADDLWARRRQLFFQPAAGYGSKAAYRGDKLTRRVFEEIIAGEYVAQALVPPSVRQVRVEGQMQEFKLDLRNYVYAGEVQLIVARLWQGQTTNFRTPGGGFAPVLAVPCADKVLA